MLGKNLYWSPEEKEQMWSAILQRITTAFKIPELPLIALEVENKLIKYASACFENGTALAMSEGKKDAAARMLRLRGEINAICGDRVTGQWTHEMRRIVHDTIHHRCQTSPGK